MRPPQLTDRLGLWALPIVSAVTFMWIVWPTVREGDWTGWLYWLASFQDFTSFGMTGRVRLFGASLATQDLP